MGSDAHRHWLLVTALGVTAAVALVAAVLAGRSTAASAVAPSNTSPPTVTGTAEVGKTLTVNRGTWSGTDPITYTYAWLRCDTDGGSCSVIENATATTYVLKGVDSGNTLRARVSAKNNDGTTNATSVPTAVVVKAAANPSPPPAPATGCPANPGQSVPVSNVTQPARLLIDGTNVQPSVISKTDTTAIVVRVHVSVCGTNAQGALIYLTATPYQQFSIPNEQQTGPDGWASLEMRRERGFPATPKQQLLVVFVRARKSGDPILSGISSRRLVSFRVAS